MGRPKGLWRLSFDVTYQLLAGMKRAHDGQQHERRSPLAEVIITNIIIHQIQKVNNNNNNSNIYKPTIAPPLSVFVRNWEVPFLSAYVNLCLDISKIECSWKKKTSPNLKSEVYLKCAWWMLSQMWSKYNRNPSSAIALYCGVVCLQWEQLLPALKRIKRAVRNVSMLSRGRCVLVGVLV